jgi:transposase
MNEQKNEQALQEWFLQAEDSKIHEIQQFIKYIRSDIESVKHALSYSWSNGIVEG